MLVYEQLPDSNPVKKSAAEYITKYEAKYGKGSRSTFGGHAWDAVRAAVPIAIPQALKKAQPGTKEFRAALRDALEGEKEVVGDARRVHDERDGPQRARQPRADDDQDRQRQVGAGQVAPR